MDDFAKSIGAVPRTQEQDDEFAKSIGASAKIAEIPTESEPDSALAVFGKQILDVPTFDFGGEIAGRVAQAGTAAANLFRSPEEQKQFDYDKFVKEYEENLEVGKEEHPAARWTGLAVGLIPAALSGGAVARGLGAVGAAIPGAAKVMQVGKAVEAAKALQAAGKTTEAAAMMPSTLTRLGAFGAKAIPTGAAFGALQGAGAAQQGETQQGALEGAVTGAVVGPVAEGFGAGLGKVHSAARQYSSIYDQGIRTLKNELVGNEILGRFIPKQKLAQVLSETEDIAQNARKFQDKELNKPLAEMAKNAPDVNLEDILQSTSEGVKSLGSEVESVASKEAKKSIQKLDSEITDKSKKFSDLLKSNKSQQDILDSQITEIQNAKKSIQDKALLTADDEVADKLLASFESMSKQEENLLNKKIQLKKQEQNLINQNQEYTSSVTKQKQDLASKIGEKDFTPKGIYEADVSTINRFKQDIMNQAEAEGWDLAKVPADKIVDWYKQAKRYQYYGEKPFQKESRAVLEQKFINPIREILNTNPKYGELLEKSSEHLTGMERAGLLKEGLTAADQENLLSKLADTMIKGEKESLSGLFSDAKKDDIVQHFINAGDTQTANKIKTLSDTTIKELLDSVELNNKNIPLFKHGLQKVAG